MVSKEHAKKCEDPAPKNYGETRKPKIKKIPQLGSKKSKQPVRRMKENARQQGRE
jgi:hypothetical protein